MPLVAHSTLPSFAKLRDSGVSVLSQEEARHQDIRELHVGLLNMMPDAALEVTERQFMRLVGGANSIVQVHVHPFTIPGQPRGAKAQAHIDAHYEDFADLQRDGLDALIVTGANPATDVLSEESFWEPLGDVMAWADQHVTSTLCSCLASHALIQRFHGLERRRMESKRWGVFQHQLSEPTHPLVTDINTRFDAPHSRWNTIAPQSLRAVGLRVLVETIDGGFHVATSPDGFRRIYFQGHPEYDAISLLKEYQRELRRYLDGELVGSPPYPRNYLPDAAAKRITAHVEEALAARAAGAPIPRFPEAELVAQLDNTWRDTGRALFSNWLGLVYRLTNHERGVTFMDGVDPSDPLGLNN